MSGARQWRRRSQARYGPERGTTYLLHFTEPYQHARHYTGWTTNLPARLAQHRRGEGSVLMKAVRDAGIGFTLARTWPDTTRDREDSLKHQGSARRFCPECGITPVAPRPASGRPGPAPRAAAPRAAAPEPVPEYDFADWPALTAAASPGQAIALALYLWRGRFAAFTAAAQAWDTPAYDARFDTACDVELAWQKAAREIAGLYGRDPDGFVREWISRTRLTAAGPERQEDMAKDRAGWRDKNQQAEADRLFAIADQLADQIERPNYQREITAERAARIREQIGEDLVAGARDQAPEPRLDGADLDAEIGRLAEKFPEPETPGPELYGDELDAEIERLAAEHPEPGTPSDWRKVEIGEHPDLARAAAEYPYRVAIANVREDYLHTTSEATRLDGWDELRAAEKALQRYRKGLEPEPGPDPLPRILAPGESAAPAPGPAGLPDGLAHPSPLLGEHGPETHADWYARQPGHQAEAG